MSNEDPKILSKVGDDRREFVKRVLVGASFAAPVIASFSIGSLSVEAALAKETLGGSSASVAGQNTSSNGNTTSNGLGAFPDPGYVGPSKFRSYIYDSYTRANGEVIFTVQDKATMTVEFDMVAGTALALSAQLMINGVVVASFSTSGNPKITTADVTNLPDIDALWSSMASGLVTLSVQGTLSGGSFSALVPVTIGGKAKQVTLKP